MSVCLSAYIYRTKPERRFRISRLCAHVFLTRQSTLAGPQGKLASLPGHFSVVHLIEVETYFFTRRTTHVQANTKKQKYERILERKMATSPEQLCKGFPSEFRSYFEYCRALRFDDRPDYSYLKRLFSELFLRKGYTDDSMFDWTILNMQQERTRQVGPDRQLSNDRLAALGGEGGGAGEARARDDSDGNKKVRR